MNVSVVIPCINEQLTIEAAVDSAWQAGACEVLVVDGGSLDESVRLAEQRRANVVRSRPGRAIQMNAGADIARGEVILFLHADCQLSHDAITQIRQALEHPQNAWGAFRQRIDAPSLIYRLIERGNAVRVRWQRLAYGDQGIFVRRQVFQDVGGFDPIPLMEDVRLSQKLARRSRPVLLAGPLMVSPRRWQSDGAIRRTIRNWQLMFLYRCGVDPERLAQMYRRHDTQWKNGRNLSNSSRSDN